MSHQKKGRNEPMPPVPGTLQDQVQSLKKLLPNLQEASPAQGGDKPPEMPAAQTAEQSEEKEEKSSAATESQEPPPSEASDTKEVRIGDKERHEVAAALSECAKEHALRE